MELIQFKSINGKKFNNLKVIWAAINPDDGDKDALKDIVNFDECDDGIYKLITNNWSTNWKTELIEDVDFKLIPVDDDG